MPRASTDRAAFDDGPRRGEHSRPATAMSAASAYDELREGTALGPYQLLVAVAQGGMARVWAARHVPTNPLFFY